MDELLQQVSDDTGIPVEMLERAARARAGAEGTTPEAIVAGWAGAEVPDAGAAAPAAAPAAQAAAPAAAAPAEEEPAEVSAEVLAPEAPLPEAEEEPEEEPEPVAVGPGVPRWLTAAFVVVPFIAILYALVVPNGPDCGNAGRLAVDPVTGVAVNCDGTEYGSEDVNFFAAGEVLYDANCAACHGPTGGGGAGPALSGGAVLATFSECADHVEWITLGSAGWPDATYGDTGKPVSGGMPGFGASLSEEDVVAVSLYERVAFGGQGIVDAESSCGVAEPAVALGG